MCQLLLPPPSGVSCTRAEVEPTSGMSRLKPPVELTLEVGHQPLPGLKTAKSVAPSSWLSSPYQRTRTRRPESVPPASAPNMRIAMFFGPMQVTGLSATLPLGSESECVPVGRNGSFPGTTAAPPDSDQPVEPFSRPPLGARK